MQNYSGIQKFLHDFVLSKKFINKSLFELEKLFFYQKIQNIENQKHVFISGLPRSGTTVILQFVYNSKEYASLTYSDMPFIMAPSLFSKFYKRKSVPKKERMHSDGLFYDLSTPEAFDEVFFSSFNTNKEIQENLIDYISLILIKYKKNKYLSKNNTNYKRISLIQNILPNSIFIIPFRNPLQHSFSLLNQHKNFINLQNKDKFILKYMNYLGHNEFGNNHQSWFKPIKYNNFDDINYWLEQWLLFYQNIINNFQSYKNCNLICYEKLCYNNDYFNKIKSILKLNENLDFKFKNSLQNITLSVDNNLLLDCNKLYDTMKIK